MEQVRKVLRQDQRTHRYGLNLKPSPDNILNRVECASQLIRVKGVEIWNTVFPSELHDTHPPCERHSETLLKVPWVHTSSAKILRTASRRSAATKSPRLERGTT